MKPRKRQPTLLDGKIFTSSSLPCDLGLGETVSFAFDSRVRALSECLIGRFQDPTRWYCYRTAGLFRMPFWRIHQLAVNPGVSRIAISSLQSPSNAPVATVGANFAVPICVSRNQARGWSSRLSVSSRAERNATRSRNCDNTVLIQHAGIRDDYAGDYCMRREKEGQQADRKAAVVALKELAARMQGTSSR